MIYLHTYGLAFLELTFVLVFLLLLHRLRPVIGAASFYIGIGSVMVFTQLVTALGIHLQHPQIVGLSIDIGPVVFFTPFMALLLIIYIVDGTLDAQRLIWGVLFMVGCFFFLAYLTENQVVSMLYEVNKQLGPDSTSYVVRMLSLSRVYLLASVLSILIEFLILPVVYEVLRYRELPLWVCVFGALIFTQVVDVFFYQLVTDPFRDFWWDALRHAFIMRSAVMIWAGLLAVAYLKMRNARQVHESSSRRPLDIVVAFIGSYGQTKKLQANVREWEGRFRMVVENAHDLILLVSHDGSIIDANRQVVEQSGYTMQRLLQMKIGDLISHGPNWPSIWGRMFRSEPFEHWAVVEKSYSCEFTLKSEDGDEFILEAGMSPLFMQQEFGILILARDVTERKKLESELAEKQNMLMHSQRMEAVGKLAGGIAHDFNNLLHAIQGSIDHLDKEVGEHPRRKQLLNNISGATTRAAGLTSQLLGFARGGKYEVTKISIGDLIRETEELFRPLSGKRIALKVAVHPDPMQIEGDYTQLQQVLLNLLINAMDALPEKEGKIILRAEPVAPKTPGFDAKPAEAGEGPYLAIRVKDNGCGIDDETLARIFEPFFTTKDVQGTGLGLAMAYGCVQNHNGWIHVETTPGKGTEFVIFLPSL